MTITIQSYLENISPINYKSFLLVPSVPLCKVNMKFDLTRLTRCLPSALSSCLQRNDLSTCDVRRYSTLNELQVGTFGIDQSENLKT